MVCASDLHAWRVLEACRHTGLRVPDDVAVLGSNRNPAIAELCQPTLSSVVYDVERVGYEAAALLGRLMAGHAGPTHPIHIPPLGIVAAESTAVRAASDPLVDQALAFIQTHREEGIGAAELSDAMPASVRTLERRFNRTLGRSPAAEIRRASIERAKNLLLTTRDPIAVIAAACGYQRCALAPDRHRAAGLQAYLFNASVTGY